MDKGEEAAAPLRVGVLGCGGRMGRMLLRTVLESPRCRLAGGVERAGAAVVGQDLGLLAGTAPVGVSAGDDAAALLREAEAVLEFTTPEATLAHAALAAEAGAVHVVGTTGLSAAQAAELRRHGERATIVWAPNMSLGVNLLLGLVRQAAAALGPDWDIEVVEMHHRHKVDAPSGTALALGQAAAAGRQVALDAVAQRVRDGITGPRAAGAIGFATLRGGDVVGEHSVILAGAGERIELAHKATDRAIFARGALAAALWARGKPAGLYGMNDVLGLSGA